MRPQAVFLIGVFGLFGSAAAQTTQFELVREIGVEVGPEEYSFGRVGGIAVTPTREILILDYQAKVIRRYDINGRYLGRFGREGGGPGEFQLPGYLRVVRNEVWVSDARLQRLTAFTLQGEFVRVVRPPERLGAVDVAFPLRDGVWLGVKSVSSLSASHVKRFTAAPASQLKARFASWREINFSRLLLTTGDRPVVDTIASWDRGAIAWYADDGSFGWLPRHWGPEATWGFGGDSILAHANSVDGTVRVWRIEGGSWRMVKAGRLALTAQPLSDSELRRLGNAERVIAGKKAQLIAPAHKSQLGQPIIADNGTVWIARISSDPLAPRAVRATQYLVVPLDGGAQFQVTLPAGFTLTAVVGDLLLGERKTENDVDIVQVWRMRPASR